MVSQHPNSSLGNEPIRYYIQSRSFGILSPSVSGMHVLRSLGKFCCNGRGPIGQNLVSMKDSFGSEHEFFVECFFNGHEALTLGVYQNARVAAVSVH